MRLYECLESGSSSSNSPTSLLWSLVEDLDVPSLPFTTSVSPPVTEPNPGLDVTPATSEPPAAAPTTALSTLAAPQVGGSTSPYLASTALNTPNPGLTRPGSGNREADGGWDLSWCKEGYWGEVCAVTSGTNGIVKVCCLVLTSRDDIINIDCIRLFNSRLLSDPKRYSALTRSRPKAPSRLSTTFRPIHDHSHNVPHPAMHNRVGVGIVNATSRNHSQLRLSHGLLHADGRTI